MILVNILGKQYPATHNEESIECYGIILFKGTKEEVQNKWEYYKMYGIPTKDQIHISNEIKKIESELTSRELIIEESSIYE